MRIFMAGDSTAAPKEAEKRPETGWFEVLGECLHAVTTLENFARNGRSSKSFIDEGLLAAAAERLGPGDLLLIQFSHNDEKDDPERHTDPKSSFPERLREFLAAARAADATPVLLTPVARRRFDPSGRLADTHGVYPDTVRELARAESVALIDITARSSELFGAAGADGSRSYFLHLAPGENPNYPDGIADDTHLSPKGAREIARLVAEGLREAGLV